MIATLSNLKNHRTLAGLLGLLAALLAIFILRLVPRATHSSYSTSSSYTAVFEWDGALKSLVLVDNGTGKEVENRELARDIASEVHRKLPYIVSGMGLHRASGQLPCGVDGTQGLYRISCSDLIESLPQDYDPDAKSPLMLAALNGDAARVKSLLLSSADVNASDQHGTTALMRSAHLDDTSTMKNLIDGGARLNAQDLMGRTALRFAVDGEREGAAKTLLASGANANIADAKGWTPLMSATSPEMARTLIDGGANVNATNADGDTRPDALPPSSAAPNW